MVFGRHFRPWHWYQEHLDQRRCQTRVRHINGNTTRHWPRGLSFRPQEYQGVRVMQPYCNRVSGGRHQGYSWKHGQPVNPEQRSEVSAPISTGLRGRTIRPLRPKGTTRVSFTRFIVNTRACHCFKLLENGYFGEKPQPPVTPYSAISDHTSNENPTNNVWEVNDMHLNADSRNTSLTVRSDLSGVAGLGIGRFVVSFVFWFLICCDSVGWKIICLSKYGNVFY